MAVVLILLYLSMGYGFLLDQQNPKNGGQTPKTGQYLTVSEFYDQMNQQHQDTEHLRHYVDKSLETLTLQIQQKLTNLDNQIGANNNCSCSSQSTDDLQQKFKSLEDNNAKLLAKLNELTRKYEQQEQEKHILETKVAELEKSRQLEVFSVNRTIERILTLKNQILSIKNKTARVVLDISELKQLRNIKPLVDIQTLESKVQSLSAETHSLNVRDQARNQDFLALYNITVGLQQDTTLLKNNQTRIVHNMDDKFTQLSRNVNGIDIQFNNSLVQMQHDISDRARSVNSSIESINQRIESNSEQVSLTATVLVQTTYLIGAVIPFGKVVTQTGIHNIAAFTQSGKFTCEKPGLYQVSVTIVTHTGGGQYSILRNGNVLVTTYITSISHAESGSADVATTLQMNDTVWVKVASSMYVYEPWSFISIVKIK